MDFQRKFLASKADTAGLGERQVRVICSTPDADRAGDVVMAEGIELSAYKANPVVLWNHDTDFPIARCVEIGVKGGQLEALVQFPPEGDDATADRIYKLIKAGVVNATSIGFQPVKADPIRGGGYKFIASELMEFSFVSVPANANALVVERSADSLPPMILRSPVPLTEEMRHRVSAAWEQAVKSGKPIVLDKGWDIISPAPATKEAPKLKIKGLYEVAWFAELLNSLGYLEECVQWEAEYEGDNSPVPEMLAEAMRQLGAALVAMTAEEVAELLSEEDGEMKSALPEKVKTFRAVVKAGRVLSSSNEDALTKARDLIDSVLVQTAPEEDEGEEKEADVDRRKRLAEALRVKAA